MKCLCCSSSSFVCLCMWKLYIHDHHSVYLRGASGSSRGRGRRSRLAKDIHAYQKNSIRHIPAKRSRNKQGGNSHKSSSGWIPPIFLIARDLADVLDALVGGVEAVKGWREERRKEREDRKNG